MTVSAEEMERKLLAVFQMPSVQTMMSRKSSITNAFVNAVIPVAAPSHEEIGEALRILGQDLDDVRCAYCGDITTEWDHFRPLVSNRRPTGFISEIANLVPACGKCNQSKGNKNWRVWMMSGAKLSPTGRGVGNVAARIALLETFEKWRAPVVVDFSGILGKEEWERYWAMCEAVIEEMRKCQEVATALRDRVREVLKGAPR